MPAGAQSWELVWEDLFDGQSLDFVLSAAMTSKRPGKFFIPGYFLAKSG